MPRTKNPKKQSSLNSGGATALEEKESDTAALHTKEKILLAATTGFARRGYDGYSSRMISADSGTHHGLIAYYFGGKLELWKACLVNLMQDLINHLVERQAAAGVTSDTEKLKIIFEEFIRFTARRPEVQAYVIDAVGRSDGRIEWIQQAMGRGAYQRWKTLILSAQRDGAFVDGDPGMLVHIFLGAATRAYVVADEVEHTMGRSPFESQFIDSHVETTLNLFFRRR